MPLQYKCHLCKLRFEREEGADVRCPRCQAVVKAPSAAQAAVLQDRCGCPNCLRAFQESASISLKCPYCGERVEQAEGRRLLAVVDGLASRIKRQLLEAIPASQIVASLTDQSVASDRAFAFVDQLVLDLPFERMQRRKAGEMLLITPTSCDACGRAGPLTLWEADWQLPPEEMQRYRKGWGGFEGDFSNPEAYARPALYYLCQPCTKETPAAFAGGYPAKNGFVRTRFSKSK